MAVGNPDTALVIFLYKECDNYQYDNQREEYGRWNLERESLSLLYGVLFQHKPDRQVRLDQINKNALSFIEEARSVVLSDYNEYKFVSESLEVDYLFRLKDEMLKGILQKMVGDSAVSSQERGAIENVLREWL